MNQHHTPLDLITALLEARARKDIDAAVACYEDSATVVTAPGQTQSGKEAQRAFTEGAVGLPIVFGQRAFVEADDIALHYSQWTLAIAGDDGKAGSVSGCTTDVLRRQPGGNWLLVVDNPWGTSVLQPAG